MSRTARLALTAALITLAACGKDGPVTGPITDLPRQLTGAESRLVESDNRFTFALLRETLRNAPAGANVFISPLSVSMALGMTLNGAAGTTFDSLRAALQLEGLTPQEINESYRGLIALLRGLDPDVTFTLANSVWYNTDYTLVPAFLEANRTYFNAQVEGLDFARAGSGSTINDWVSRQTAGRIPQIVPENLSDDMVVFLVNAIYFKAAWTQRFDRALTEQQPFQLAGAGGGTVNVPLMTHGTPVPLLLHAEPGVTVADLPYGGGAWRATLVIADNPDSLATTAADLTRERWDAWVAALDSTEMTVYLPRFTLRYDLDSIVPVLKTLGTRIAWCDEPPYAFDFTRLLAQPVACLSSAKHKTFVEVNEEGTEAAAATSIGVGVTSAPAELRVDRPFLLVIRERLSGAILFIGRIMNPAAG